jgi:hypothetical protein
VILEHNAKQDQGSIESVSWLQQRLRQASERRRAIEVTALGVVAISLVVVATGVYGLADWLVRFPQSVRGLITAGALAGGYLALKKKSPKWIPPKMDVDEMARHAELMQEKGGKQAHSRMVAAIEFGERPKIPGDTELKNLVIREARTECTDPCDLRLYNPKHVKVALRLGLAAVVVLLVATLVVPTTSRVFLWRLCCVNAQYPTSTKLAGVDWKRVAPARQNYPVLVTVSGKIPTSGLLHVRMSGRRTFDVPLQIGDATTGSVFMAVVPAPDKPFTFTFRIGDFESERYSVHVAEPMYVKTGSISVMPPAYTKQPSATEPLGGVTAVEGSQLRIVVTPDRPARKVEFVMDGKTLPLHDQPNGSWTLVLLATNSFNYAIAMSDEYDMANADQLKHGVVVIPDAVPTLDVKSPRSDTYISVASLVPFEVQAHDDYGLVQMSLEYEIFKHENEKDTLLKKGQVKLDHATLSGKSVFVEQMVRAADLNLAAGQRIVFHLAATDNKPGAINVGRAPDIALLVVEPDELKRVLDGEMTQMATLMRKLRDSEKKQADAIFERISTGEKL